MVFLGNWIHISDFVENNHISIFTTFAKQSMINRLSNPINRNRSAAKISKVMSFNDDSDSAVGAVQDLLARREEEMQLKTETMNSLLNEVVPYFRCSDDEIVKIYYFLWSLHLMYYTQGDRGMQTIPHTQTAVNNFLGMHR